MPDNAAPLTAADVDRAALRIPCPICTAIVGARCTAGGYGYKALQRPHRDRRTAAQKEPHA